jgi:hypothetical protein
VFKDRLPDAFVSKHVHWYDHDQDEVIFRPRAYPWPTNDNNDEWRLKKVGLSWRLAKGTDILVSMSSRTSRTLARLFDPLEDILHIHIRLDTTSKDLAIELPRLQLDFSIGAGDSRIHSRQYRGMELWAESQNANTLIGLVSKLVLRNPISDDRLILIPEGTVKYAKISTAHYVSVSVDKDTAVKVHAVVLDPILGRLVDNGDLHGKFFLSYLHALTSFHLPDPLTGYTGTESALNILRSATVRSFEVLTPANIGLLTLIAKLSPSRLFYPDYLQVMQQIKWDPNLPALSQHADFTNLVQDIFNQARKMKVFYASNGLIDTKGLPLVKVHLHERDAIRTSTFRVCEYGAENFTISQDTIYEARDQDLDSQRGRRAFLAANTIVRDSAALYEISSNFKDTFSLLFQTMEVKGLDNTFKSTRLRFDTEWLGDSPKLLATIWCNLHKELVKGFNDCSKYDIMLWLSTMAFAESANMQILQALATFCRFPDLASVQIPAITSANLSCGDAWNPSKIRSFTIYSWPKYMYECPEASMRQDETVSRSTHLSRINARFEARQKATMDSFVSQLKSQWPTRIPTIPRTTDIDTYIRVSRASQEVQATFQTWFDNLLFNQYLERLTIVLEQQVVQVPAAPLYTFIAPSESPTLEAEERFLSSSTVLALPAPNQSLFVQKDEVQLACPPEPEISVLEENPRASQLEAGLDDLCDKLSYLYRADCEKDYVNALTDSCDALKEHDAHSKIRKVQVNGDTEMQLRHFEGACRAYLGELGIALAQVVATTVDSSNALASTVTHIPRISPTFWLGYLNRNRFGNLTELWKAAIIEYGLAITRLHRARRLLVVFNKPQELAEELDHTGHKNWTPSEFPETLLLEIESGFMVRERQEVIAREMRAPRDAANTVMQLNMGEGKSSTIVPMVAAFLTNKDT